MDQKFLPGLLVVDDDPLMLSTYRRMLARHCDMICAASAEEALAALDGASCAAVISDYNMPRHDGVWLLRELRRRHPGLRRILISGGTVPELGEHLRCGLVQRFLTKPVLRKDVLACLNFSGPQREE